LEFYQLTTLRYNAPVVASLSVTEARRDGHPEWQNRKEMEVLVYRRVSREGFEDLRLQNRE